MRKGLALALAAGVIMSTGTAFAAENGLKVDGSVQIQYRDDEKTFNDGSKQTSNGFRETFVLNANQKITDNLDLFARFTYQNLAAGVNGTGDYIKDDYNGGIDSFGLKLKQGSWNWTAGEQGFTIGGQGLIYDNGFIGKYSNPYAIIGNGKLGLVDTTVFYARTHYQKGYDQDNFAGAQFSYGISDAAKVGVFYTKWNAGTSSEVKFGYNNLNFYGIDYNYQIDKKLGFAAEYAKSSASNNNKAYIAGFDYDATGNDNLAAKYYRSEDLSNIPDMNWSDMTTAPNSNAKGVILSWRHTLSKNTNVKLAYDTQNPIKKSGAVSGTSTDRDRTRLSYNITF